jgi:hypothetical protein
MVNDMDKVTNTMAENDLFIVSVKTQILDEDGKLVVLVTEKITSKITGKTVTKTVYRKEIDNNL